MGIDLQIKLKCPFFLSLLVQSTKIRWDSGPTRKIKCVRFIVKGLSLISCNIYFQSCDVNKALKSVGWKNAEGYEEEFSVTGSNWLVICFVLCIHSPWVFSGLVCLKRCHCFPQKWLYCNSQRNSDEIFWFKTAHRFYTVNCWLWKCLLIQVILNMFPLTPPQLDVMFYLWSIRKSWTLPPIFFFTCYVNVTGNMLRTSATTTSQRPFPALF